jgi:hypothetical protein
MVSYPFPMSVVASVGRALDSGIYIYVHVYKHIYVRVRI